ncbi:hypothetical protein F1D05_03775 [Kribbella qitaiheensis]|uniref:Uncharacterized protein n=1 Tax=Kribbella qitaiheensis TaxID=1544730 RepID=A0A7G6WT78_9ACTN|nr:hypothetical protein [Kribbella qitaiheensis]QNE17193.1 hypothetical protein F1D05_03775 [Kribbella qitaiheensis]
MNDNGWLQIHAGSEYEANWERYFSQAEEERVTALAEELVPTIELLESAQLWRAASAEKRIWLVLVLHKKASRILRGVSADSGGRPYVETVLPWENYAASADQEQKEFILDRMDTVFRELLKKKDTVPD